MLLVCGSKNIFLVDILAYQLLNKIECQSIVTLYKVSNNFVFSGQSNGDIKQWDCVGRDVKLYSYKNQGHSPSVVAIFRFNDIIVSGGRGGDLKFWEYK